jgi:hypothetical protein
MKFKRSIARKRIKERQILKKWINKSPVFSLPIPPPSLSPHPPHP